MSRWCSLGATLVGVRCSSVSGTNVEGRLPAGSWLAERSVGESAGAPQIGQNGTAESGNGPCSQLCPLGQVKLRDMGRLRESKQWAIASNALGSFLLLSKVP